MLILVVLAIKTAVDRAGHELGSGGVILVLVVVGVVVLGVLAFRRLNRPSVLAEERVVIPASPATPVRQEVAVAAPYAAQSGWSLAELPPDVAAQPWDDPRRSGG